MSIATCDGVYKGPWLTLYLNIFSHVVLPPHQAVWEVVSLGALQFLVCLVQLALTRHVLLLQLGYVLVLEGGR